MKCIKCGAELTEDTKFCSYCGAKIEDESQTPSIPEVTIEENVVEEVEVIENEPVYTQAPKNKSIVDKAKEIFMSYWNKIDLFCKIETIVGAITILLLIISVLNAKILPVLFSLLQVGGLVVAFLLYKGKIKTNKTWMKFLALALSAFLTFVNISSYSWFNDFNVQEKILNNFTKVNTPYSSQDCVNKNKDTVINDFRLAGFSNISEEKIEDLEISETDKYEKVEFVTINEVASFDANKEFKASSKVIIKYHSYKCENVPFSYDEAKNMETELILKAFEEAGFVDIKTDEVYDLNPDDTDVAFENRISIDETTSFEKDAKFPLNAKVKITTHRPYEMYNLKVIIDFVPNLIFSKYDVEFEVGGNYETLTHGNDATFEYRLKQGKYTVEFESEESSSVTGKAEIDLTGDTEVSYKIYCYSDRISVDTIYLENKGAVGENDAMVPSSASNCKFKNYKDIEKIFKNAGFTNISTNILYDIALGWTEEGEVDSVSIDGKINFERGDVFSKVSPVIITYHMKIEDNPNRIFPPYTSDTASGKDYNEIVRAFEEAGWTNVRTEKCEETDIWGHRDGEVGHIYVNGESVNQFKNYSLDDEVRIVYYVIVEGGPSKTELSSYYAQKAFEKYGESIYPYGFKCHWVLDYIAEEKRSDGSYFLKVGVTITNMYGAEYKTVAEGVVSGSDANAKVVQFYVSK